MRERGHMRERRTYERERGHMRERTYERERTYVRENIWERERERERWQLEIGERKKFDTRTEYYNLETDQSVDVQTGTAVVFSNTLPHHVRKITNYSPESNQQRTFLNFFIVDPSHSLSSPNALIFPHGGRWGGEGGCPPPHSPPPPSLFVPSTLSIYFCNGMLHSFSSFPSFS
jgi:hypothetical protein